MAVLERKNWREIFRLETNQVIKVLTISDIFIASGFGLMSPIFAVFLTGKIKGGNVEVAGLAAMIFLLTKSLGQLPTAQVIDKIKGEKDDYWAMLVGSISTSFIPLLYILARTPGDIYLIQFLYGLSQSLTFPSWLAIFTRHVGFQKEGVSWGMYYTLIDLFGAGAAAAGGAIAYRLGFIPLFLTISLFSFIGSSWLLLIRREMRKKPKASNLS